MKCKLEVVLSHSTMRGEKAGSEIGAMASDLTIKGPVLCNDLEGLFSTPASYEQLLGSLYNGNDEMVTGDLDTILLKTEFENVNATISSAVGTEASAQKFPKSRLKNIVLCPKAGRQVEFKATLQVYPDDAQWAQIAHLREKTVEVKMTGGKFVEAKPDKQGKLPISEDAVDAQGRQLQ